MPSTVDDFEDNDIAEYTGDTGSFSIESTPIEGTYSLRSTGYNSETIVSQSGLANYPSKGDTFAFLYEGRKADSDQATLFGVQDSNDRYEIMFGPRNGINGLAIRKRNAGSPTTLAQDTSWTPSTNQVYDVEVEWASNDTITATVWEASVSGGSVSRGTQVAQASATDSDFASETGMGFATFGETGNVHNVWDYYRIRTAPDAPSSLSVASTTEDQLDLSWTDNSSDEDGFYVYRAQSSGTTTTDYTQVADLAAGTTSYTDTGLEDGERFFYRVSAYNDIGESSLSNEDNATTILPATTPTLDTSVEDEITVSWTKQDDSSDGEWELFRSEDGTLGTKIGDAITPTTSSFTDTSREDGEKYYYTLRRITDHASADGTQQSGITLLPATTPSLDATVEDEISLSWTKQDDSGDGEWEIYRSTDGTLGSLIADALAPSTSSYTDTGLNDGEQYHYTLRRVTDHTSADGSQQSAVTVLPAPTSLASPAHSSTTIDLTWTDNHDYGDTEVQYKPSDVTSWTTFSTLSRNTEAETVTGLRNGELYDLRVRAVTEHTKTVDQ